MGHKAILKVIVYNSSRKGGQLESWWGQPDFHQQVARWATWFFLGLLRPGWVNNWDAGNLRHHHAHYDFTVMMKRILNMRIVVLSQKLNKNWYISSAVVWVFVQKTMVIASNPAYICQCTGSAFVQIMACRLFGTKPSSKPMLGYC